MAEHEPHGEKPEPQESDDQTAVPESADSKDQDKKPKPQQGGAEERNVGG